MHQVQTSKSFCFAVVIVALICMLLKLAAVKVVVVMFGDDVDVRNITVIGAFPSWQLGEKKIKIGGLCSAGRKCGRRMFRFAAEDGPVTCGDGRPFRTNELGGAGKTAMETVRLSGEQQFHKTPVSADPLKAWQLQNRSWKVTKVSLGKWKV